MEIILLTHLVKQTRPRSWKALLCYRNIGLRTYAKRKAFTLIALAEPAAAAKELSEYQQ